MPDLPWPKYSVIAFGSYVTNDRKCSAALMCRAVQKGADRYWYNFSYLPPTTVYSHPANMEKTSLHIFGMVFTHQRLSLEALLA